MKSKVIIFICSTLLIFTFLTHIDAQVIPNGDFEEWETLGMNIEGPVGWITTSYAGNAEKTTDAQQGNYAIMLTTILAEGETFFGGAFNDGTLDNTPTELRGYYKCNIANGDVAEINIDFTSQGDFIGNANIEFESNESDYTYFSVPIEYFVSDPVADHFYIEITSSTGEGVVGSVLFIDNLYFDGTSTAIDELGSAKLNMVITPNPAIEILTISLDNYKDNLDMIIYDLRGKIVEARQFNQSSTIDVSQYPNGQYIVKLIDSSNKLIQTSNFIVAN